MESGYEQQISDITEHQGNMMELLRTHLYEGGTLEREHFDSLRTATGEFYYDMLKALGVNYDERRSLANTFASDLHAIDAQSAFNALKESQRRRNNTVEQAQLEYEERLACDRRRGA